MIRMQQNALRTAKRCFLSRLLHLCPAIFLMFPVLLIAQEANPESLYNRAGAAYDKGDVKGAITLYEELLRKDPDSVEARTNLGVALAHEGRYAEAIHQYREALKRDPKSSVVRLNLGLALYKEVDFSKASTEFESLHQQDPENRQALYLLADCYLRLGRYRDATNLLEPEYKAHPDDPAIEYALGTALIQDGQIDRGAVVIDQILKNGNSAEAMLLTGTSQYAAGKYDSAVATIGKALDLNPNLPGGWTLLGRASLKTNDNERAKASFRRALDADPNDFDANIHLGGILRHDGDNTGAAPYLDRALTLRPDSAAARFQVGALEVATGHLEEAKQKLEPLEKEWPDFVEVHLQLASLYARMNRPADSARERQIVLALNAKARSEGPQPEPQH